MFMLLPAGPGSPSWIQLHSYVYRPFQFLQDAKQRFGDVFTIRLGRLGNLIVVHRRDHVEQVFQAKASFLTSALSNDIAKPVVGSRSVFVLDGAEHLARRKTLLGQFQAGGARQHQETVAEVVRKRIAQYQTGKRLVLHGEFHQMALEIIFRLVFGVTDSQELGSLDRAFRELFRPMPAIFSFLPGLQADFPGSPFSFWLKKRRELVASLTALVARRRADPELHSHRDVLAALLLARDSAGNPLSVQDLTDELITEVVAGHETVATQLAWVFDYLLRAPEAIERIRAESSADGREPSSSPYLDAFLSEVLRMRPVFPLVARGVRHDGQLGELHLPRGSIVAPCLLLAHYDERNYPEPGAFRPERWLGGQRDPYLFLPFGGGIRRCAGMALAELEMKTIVTAFVHQLDLKPAQPERARMVRRNITLFPEGGVQATVVYKRTA